MTMDADHPSCCPRCSADFVYRLDVKPGGGLRYAVSCTRCDNVYFQVSAPTLASARLAA